MFDDKEQTDTQSQEQPTSIISRRKLLASLGMAGVALASTGIVNSGIAKAYADPVNNRKQVKELMNSDFVVITTIAALQANTAPDENLIYFVKDRGVEGHFYYDALDTTSVDDMESVLVSTSGARFKRIFEDVNENSLQAMLSEDGLYEYARVKPTPPAGQNADEAEAVIPYKGTLYCLFKGSYAPQNDNSYICVVRPVGKNTLKIVSRMDLGIGADARAMAIYNDDLFVFTNDKIKVFRIIDAVLQLKVEYTRKFGGWMQTCKIINGRLYAPNWGTGTIDRFDLVNGVPSNEIQYSIGAIGNASIASYGSIHYLITWTETNNITRLDIDENGDVFNRGVFAIPGVYLPRYADIYNGIMTIGGYSTLNSKTVVLDITSATPVKIGAYHNMPTHIRVGNYLIGHAADQSTPENSSKYGKTVKVSISDGTVEVLADRPLIYPVRYQSTIFGFLGSTSYPSLIQEIICYSTQSIRKGIEIPTNAQDYKYMNTIRYTKVSNYAAGEVIARFKNYTPARIGWLKVKISYTIINNQNVPGQTKTTESVYSAFKNSSGNWQIIVPRADVVDTGDLTVNLDFQVSGTNAYVSVSGALTNALINLVIDFELSDNNMGSFYSV
ncbi:hypothetical protein [Paenibacillus eucommiae]|uniref:Uncharacterized protein n=1 Tax=Paenibacillus eucommiae TaxID=1355755 RepID=A0ABS4IVQ8_9BACL|nr:hypothetical protein [Paenibacillus eucommiae]MBP1991670.1 hypothetical protein [Paenibacillus eucommiae]